MVCEFTGTDRYYKHYFTGMVGTIQLLIRIIIVYQGSDNFKDGLLWNYPTVGPQCGTETARTVCLLWIGPYQIKMVHTNKGTHCK
jgi:hypothetical protein